VVESGVALRLPDEQHHSEMVADKARNNECAERNAEEDRSRISRHVSPLALVP